MLKWTSMGITRPTVRGDESLLLDPQQTSTPIITAKKFKQEATNNLRYAVTLPRYEEEEYPSPARSCRCNHSLYPDPLSILQARYLYNNSGIVWERKEHGRWSEGKSEVADQLPHDESLEEFINIIMSSARKSSSARSEKKRSTRKTFTFKRAKMRILKFDSNRSETVVESEGNNLSPSYTACQDPASDLSLNLSGEGCSRGAFLLETPVRKGLAKGKRIVFSPAERRQLKYEGRMEHSEVGVALPEVYV